MAIRWASSILMATHIPLSSDGAFWLQHGVQEKCGSRHGMERVRCSTFLNAGLFLLSCPTNFDGKGCGVNLVTLWCSDENLLGSDSWLLNENENRKRDTDVPMGDQTWVKRLSVQGVSDLRDNLVPSNQNWGYYSAREGKLSVPLCSPSGKE